MKTFAEIKRGALFKTGPGTIWRKSDAEFAYIVWTADDDDLESYYMRGLFHPGAQCCAQENEDVPPRPSPLFGWRWAHSGEQAEVWLAAATQVTIAERHTSTCDWPLRTNLTRGYIIKWPDDPRIVLPMTAAALEQEYVCSPISVDSINDVVEQTNKYVAMSLALPTREIYGNSDSSEWKLVKQIEEEEDQRILGKRAGEGVIADCPHPDRDLFKDPKLFRELLMRAAERGPSTVAKVAGIGISAPEPDVGYQDQYGDEDWL